MPPESIVNPSELSDLTAFVVVCSASSLFACKSLLAPLELSTIKCGPTPPDDDLFFIQSQSGCKSELPPLVIAVLLVAFPVYKVD